jgi:hypothetical protein
MPFCASIPSPGIRVLITSVEVAPVSYEVIHGLADTEQAVSAAMVPELMSVTVNTPEVKLAARIT